MLTERICALYADSSRREEVRRVKTTCRLLGVVLLATTLGTAGFAGAPQESAAQAAGGQPACSSCSGGIALQTEGSCPYTITIQCWCDIEPFVICCIRQICRFPYDWAPYCNDCWFYERCYVDMRSCDNDPRESAASMPLESERPQ